MRAHSTFRYLAVPISDYHTLKAYLKLGWNSTFPYSSKAKTPVVDFRVSLHFKIERKHKWNSASPHTLKSTGEIQRLLTLQKQKNSRRGIPRLPTLQKQKKTEVELGVSLHIKVTWWNSAPPYISKSWENRGGTPRPPTHQGHQVGFLGSPQFKSIRQLRWNSAFPYTSKTAHC